MAQTVGRLVVPALAGTPCGWKAFGETGTKLTCESGRDAAHILTATLPVAPEGTALCGLHSPYDVTEADRAATAGVADTERTLNLRNIADDIPAHTPAVGSVWQVMHETIRITSVTDTMVYGNGQAYGKEWSRARWSRSVHEGNVRPVYEIVCVLCHVNKATHELKAGSRVFGSMYAPKNPAFTVCLPCREVILARCALDGVNRPVNRAYTNITAVFHEPAPYYPYQVTFQAPACTTYLVLDMDDAPAVSRRVSPKLHIPWANYLVFASDNPEED
jgi:hypothetical protein